MQRQQQQQQHLPLAVTTDATPAVPNSNWIINCGGIGETTFPSGIDFYVICVLLLAQTAKVSSRYFTFFSSEASHRRRPRICCLINFILFQHQRRCHQTLEGGVACVLCHGAFIAKDRTDLSKHVFRSHMYDKRFHLRPSASSTKLPVAANNSAPPSRIMLLSITS